MKIQMEPSNLCPLVTHSYQRRTQGVLTVNLIANMIHSSNVFSTSPAVFYPWLILQNLTYFKQTSFNEERRRIVSGKSSNVDALVQRFPTFFFSSLVPLEYTFQYFIIHKPPTHFSKKVFVFNFLRSANEQSNSSNWPIMTFYRLLLSILHFTIYFDFFFFFL